MPGTMEKKILSTLFSYTEMWLVKYSYLIDVSLFLQHFSKLDSSWLKSRSML